MRTEPFRPYASHLVIACKPSEQLRSIALGGRLEETGSIGLAKIIHWQKPASEILNVKASQVRSWPVATFAADAQGQFVFVNPHWTQLTGLPLSAALGPGWAASVYDDDRQEAVGLWNESQLLTFKIVNPSTNTSEGLSRALVCYQK
jgi:PAS domain-containing protein